MLPKNWWYNKISPKTITYYDMLSAMYICFDHSGPIRAAMVFI